ncbi:MAG TPA: Spx/MgsR family RNA polymerase-binding regulatory protein [Rhodanobacteraceae bacterium]|nr:Spx/MgsR family RNA polymerase-binding regulatory protein [Rhodanobacteraceae bacterium]
MSVTLYGLNTCDTCKKARNWLARSHIDHTFVDYRERPIPADKLKEYANAVGGWEKLVNRSSMTWRNLPEARKKPQSDPEWTLLIREHPALVRRPLVVMADGDVSVGFTNGAFEKLFA